LRQLGGALMMAAMAECPAGQYWNDIYWGCFSTWCPEGQAPHSITGECFDPYDCNAEGRKGSCCDPYVAAGPPFGGICKTVGAWYPGPDGRQYQIQADGSAAPECQGQGGSPPCCAGTIPIFTDPLMNTCQVPGSEITDASNRHYRIEANGAVTQIIKVGDLINTDAGRCAVQEDLNTCQPLLTVIDPTAPLFLPPPGTNTHVPVYETGGILWWGERKFVGEDMYGSSKVPDSMIIRRIPFPQGSRYIITEHGYHAVALPGTDEIKLCAEGWANFFDAKGDHVRAQGIRDGTVDFARFHVWDQIQQEKNDDTGYGIIAWNPPPDKPYVVNPEDIGGRCLYYYSQWRYFYGAQTNGFLIIINTPYVVSYPEKSFWEEVGDFIGGIFHAIVDLIVAIVRLVIEDFFVPLIGGILDVVDDAIDELKPHLCGEAGAVIAIGASIYFGNPAPVAGRAALCAGAGDQAHPCAPGYQKDPTSGQCVFVCPPGQEWDAQLFACKRTLAAAVKSNQLMVAAVAGGVLLLAAAAIHKRNKRRALAPAPAPAPAAPAAA